MPSVVKLVMDVEGCLGRTKQSIQKACDEAATVCVGPKIEFCDWMRG